MRLEDRRIARQIAEWNPHGKRRLGRPVSTRKDKDWGQHASKKPQG